MQIVLVIGYTFLFLFIIRRMSFFSVDSISPNWISLVFVLKVMAGCLLGLLYTYYYKDRTTADTFKFFDDGRVLSDSLWQHPKDFFSMLTGVNGDSPDLDVYYSKMNAWYNKDVMFNDNKTIIRLNAIFNLFSIRYYYVNVVFINFISFSGLFALFKLFQSFQSEKSKELFAGVMFLPSVLFWGSGLLKDGLLLFALGMLLYSFNKLIRMECWNVGIMEGNANGSKHSNIPTFHYSHSIAFVASFLLLTFTKLYVIFTILPGVIGWFWSRKDGWKGAVPKFSSLYAVYFIVAFNIGAFTYKYDLSDLIYWKQHNFFEQAQLTQAKSVIQIPHLTRSVFRIIQNSPHAIINVLTRPTLWEASSPLIMISAVENMLIVLMIIICLLYRKSIYNVPPAIFLFSLIFVVLMFDLIGLITPILGAIVRYKVPALPFLMFILICFYDKEKVQRRFGKTRL